MITRLPALTGVIRRRVLVNFRVDPRYVEPLLPPWMRPQLVGARHRRHLPDQAGGPPPPAESSHHRHALRERRAPHRGRMGLQCWPPHWRVPRRDSDSRFNTLVGGRPFPGVHHHAEFVVTEDGDRVAVAMRSRDGRACVSVRGCLCADFPADSAFPDLEHASAFFRCGALGLTPKPSGRLDALELDLAHWSVIPVRVDSVATS